MSNTPVHDNANGPSISRVSAAGRHRKPKHLRMRVQHFLGAAATGPVAAAGVAFPAPAAFADDGGPSAADQQISAGLDTRIQDDSLGPNVSGVVLDAASDRQVWGHNASTALMPASNTKLATATAALTVLGPDHTFTTRVVYGHGTLTLIGGGDRVLTTADLTALAKTAAAALAADDITSVKVKVDDRLFPKPTPATGWKPDYYAEEIAPVRALVVDGHKDMDTSLHAGTVFATELAAQGVETTGAVTRGAATATDRQVAGHNSPPLSSIVETMLLNSDNNIAETLLRMTAIGAGRPATFEGGTSAVRQVISQRYGVAMDSVELYDGSGLSRANRIPATALAGLLDRATDPATAPRSAPSSAAFRSPARPARSALASDASTPPPVTAPRARSGPKPAPSPVPAPSAASPTAPTAAGKSSPSSRTGPPPSRPTPSTPLTASRPPSTAAGNPAPAAFRTLTCPERSATCTSTGILMPDAAKDRYKKPMYTRRQFVGIATGVGTTLALVAVSAAFGKAGAQRKTYTSQQELVEAKNAISEILSSSDPVKTAAWIVGTGDAPTSVKTEMDQQLDALTQAVAAGTGAKDPASIVVSRTRDAATQRRIWDRKYDFLRRGDGGAGTFGTITEESRGQYGDTLGAGIQWDPDNEAHRIVWSSLTPEQRQIEILQTSTAPGVSQHHSGAAADLFSTEPNDWSNNGPLAAQYTWLSRNAARYGFIQTYTASSAKDQPAVSAEPWHWAYAPVSEAILDFIRADPSTIRGQLENLWNYAPGRYTYIHENWQNYVFHVNERAHFA